MIDTCHVQRLKAPPKSEWAARVDQVFGGGMLGLRKEAWDILQSIFSIDSMGYAEYEFGTLPKTLKAMAEDREQLRAFTTIVRAKDIDPNSARGYEARTKAGKFRKKQPVHPSVTDKTIYVVARETHMEGAKEAVCKLAGNKIQTKGSSGVARALDPIGEWDADICAWLEVDNGFFFTVDKAMWGKFTILLTGKDPEV
jgi:hypothetical protein